MGTRRPNPRLAKIHRNYTVGEAAGLFGVHPNTVLNWIKQGLPTSDAKRPTLILGRELAEFLKARRAKNKQTCQPGEMYCLRCRAPKVPDGNMVDYEVVTEKIGNLVAICPDCYLTMNRRVSFAKLDQVRGKMDITFPLALRHIVESA
jgi:hypothetical protein